VKWTGERILLVEDKIDVRAFLVDLLNENGYRTYEAGCAEEALTVYRKQRGRFDLIFSDVVLPDKSGVDLVEEIIAQKPGIRVLLSSGYGSGKSQLDRISEQGFPFLPKPYGSEELFKTLQEAMQKR
jgi:DNA-binding NtrC family response regulator